MFNQMQMFIAGLSKIKGLNNTIRIEAYKAMDAARLTLAISKEDKEAYRITGKLYNKAPIPAKLINIINSFKLSTRVIK
jgi:hypothetical protein